MTLQLSYVLDYHRGMDACDRRPEAWPLFLKTYSALIEQLGRELEAERNLPLTWFDVLIQLNKTDEGRMPMHELADSVLLSKSGVTRLVDRMTRAGLVTRESCETDRRVVYASLTPKGRTAFDKAAPVHFRGIKEHFSDHLTATERKTLQSVLKKLLDAQTAPSEERAAG